LKGFASVSVPLIDVRDVDGIVIEKSISALAFAAGGVGGIEACLAESLRGVVSFREPTCFGISWRGESGIVGFKIDLTIGALGG
jgi:hypothetical protein